jgi:glucose/arabinose dehydrogenase
MSPFDRHIYVAHSKIYFAGGANPNSQFYPYIGQVSRIRYPGYTVCEAVVTNLPVSNHDHAPNGIQFSDDGTLLLGIGGNTNAGVPHFRLGFLDESPLTAAIVAFRIYAPGFNGKLNYYSSDPTHQLNNDQRFGGSVSLGPMYANYVSVWAAGARNPFDLVYTTTKRIFFTDNGPNQGYGLLSNGPSSTLSDSTETDKLCDATTPNRIIHSSSF